MKQSILLLAFAIISLTACQPPEKSIDMNDLGSVKTALKEKKQALAALQLEITDLEKKASRLDTAARRERVKLVTTQKAEKTDFAHYVDIQGTVQTDKMAAATSEIGGRIMKMNVVEGQTVSAGQLIAETDISMMDKQMEELEKNLELAVTVFQRQDNLWKQNIGSEMQFLQAKNNKERLEQSMETLREQMKKAKVYAPMSGVVEMVMAKQGELAMPGMPIIQILSLTSVKVEADVSETYLPAVKRGATVQVSFPALELEKDARISLIGSSINPANRTFRVEANLSNPGNMLKPNLLAYMKIKDFEQKDVVVIPTEIIQQDINNLDFVYIKSKNKAGKAIAKKTSLETGRSHDGMTMIVSGLNEGDEVIVKGSRNLADGELINVEASPKAAKETAPKEANKK